MANAREEGKKAFYRSVSTLGLETIQGHLMEDAVTLEVQAATLEVQLEETIDNLLWIGLELKNRENLREIING